MTIVKGKIENTNSGLQKAETEKSVIPAIGSKRLHRPRVSRADLLYSNSRRRTKSLIGLLLGHSLRAERLSLPRTNVKLRALTPTGRPAVKIRFG